MAAAGIGGGGPVLEAIDARRIERRERRAVIGVADGVITRGKIFFGRTGPGLGAAPAWAPGERAVRAVATGRSRALSGGGHGGCSPCVAGVGFANVCCTRRLREWWLGNGRGTAVGCCEVVFAGHMHSAASSPEGRLVGPLVPDGCLRFAGGRGGLHAGGRRGLAACVGLGPVSCGAPHVGCVIPGGGVGRRRALVGRPVAMVNRGWLGGGFRGPFKGGRGGSCGTCSPGLERADRSGEQTPFGSFRRSVFGHAWVAYARRPFGGAGVVLDKLAGGPGGVSHSVVGNTAGGDIDEGRLHTVVAAGRLAEVGWLGEGARAGGGGGGRLMRSGFVVGCGGCVRTRASGPPGLEGDSAAGARSQAGGGSFQ